MFSLRVRVFSYLLNVHTSCIAYYVEIGGFRLALPVKFLNKGSSFESHLHKKPSGVLV
jgi:hypothetical protein